MTASEVDVETGEEGEVGMEETETVEEEEEEEVILILGSRPLSKVFKWGGNAMDIVYPKSPAFNSLIV